MNGRRIARIVIALVAIGFTIRVATTMKQRTSVKTEPPVPRTDPAAVVEGEGGTAFRVKGDQEDLRVHYDRLLTYPNGASKMVGVKVITDQDGRTFTVTSAEGQFGENESTIELSGKVRLEASDGMVVTGDRATYVRADGMVRVPGPATFERGRMRGTGIGLDFDQAQNIVSIGDQAAITYVPRGDGTGGMTLASGSLQFRRAERVIQMDRGSRITREQQVIEADQSIAHLTEDEQRVQLLELRGNSRITTTPGASGGLRAMRGRDMDLRYGEDGLLLDRAVITGNADLQLAGDAAQGERRIAGNAITIDLAADGSTPTSLVARDNVTVTLPGGAGTAARTIAAQTLDGTGDGSRGLTGARFTGGVQFTEQRPGSLRTARSQNLDVAMAPGFGAIEDASFARAVRFTDGPLLATAAAARYAIKGGMLALSGSEPGNLTPHVVNEQIDVGASSIDITLEGPVLSAAGAVKSVLTPKTNPQSGAPQTRLPSMLKDDQPVNVTADALSYDGPGSKAVYTGNALLWQGETSVKGSAITLNGTSGDLLAAGPVTTSTMLLQEEKPGVSKKVSSIGTAKEFSYVDATRRATYTGDAHITGPQGDLTSARVELFTKESGEELERVEAYDGVTLRGEGRTTTGSRLTYFGADERYLVTGTPVTIIDACGRETTGRTLTFFRATDRIVVDGNEQNRTQTRGKSNCS